MGKFKWYYNRLKLMSSGEIIYRFKNFLFVFLEKLTRNRNAKKIKKFSKFNNFYIENFENIINFYNNNAELKEKLFNNANLLLEHKISFFSLKNHYFGEEINWHRDYSSEKTFPLEFYADIDFKQSKYGDIKYVWELNRFQHIFTLAQAYVISKEKKYASEVINQISNWIDKNPYLLGVNWSSPIETALRLISWGWSLFVIEKNGYQIEKTIKEKISTSIWQQTEFIYNHLSLYSSANDHLIAEGAGLAFIGAFLDFGKDSEKWLKKGTAILFEELDKQFYDDGLNKEQAFGYHCFTLNLFLTVFLLLEKNNICISGKYWNKIEKMAEIILNFADNKLNLPNFGDNDDSFVLKLDNYYEKNLPVKQNAEFLLNAASIIFNRGDFKYLAKNLDETTLWLFNKEKIDFYSQISVTRPQNNSLYLKNSGYMLFKDDNTHAYFDAGNHGYLSIAAHAHADALSFCLNYKNREFLVDSGTYSYSSKNKLRDYFRGTSAHNTVMVDGQNQSEPGGDFMWMKKARTSVEKTLICDKFDYIRAFHDGYIQQNINVKHIREVLFNKNKFFVIIDRLNNFDGKKHDFELNWHFHKDCEIENNQENYVISRENNNIFLKILCSQEFQTNKVKSLYSESFDKKEESYSLKSTIKSDKDIIVITMISFEEEFLEEINNFNKQDFLY
jgi:hypothetical protein